MKISFLMPTNKPFNEFGNKILGSLEAADKLGYDYEVLIFSRQPISHPVCRWFDESQYPSEGAVFGYNYLYQHCDGDYIMIGVDDQQFHPSIFEIFKKLESDFANKKFQILSAPCRDKCHLNDDPNIGFLPRWVMPRFPAFSRQTIDKELNGCLFNPRFKHHYADSWLGYFMGANGQMAEECVECGGVMPFGYNGSFPHDNYDKSVFLEMVDNHQSGIQLSYV